MHALKIGQKLKHIPCWSFNTRDYRQVASAFLRNDLHVPKAIHLMGALGSDTLLKTFPSSVSSIFSPPFPLFERKYAALFVLPYWTGTRGRTLQKSPTTWQVGHEYKSWQTQISKPVVWRIVEMLKGDESRTFRV